METPRLTPILNEDWSAVAIAFLIVSLFIAGITFSFPSWNWESSKFSDAGHLINLGVVWIMFFALILITYLLQRKTISANYAIGYSFIFLITVIALIITSHPSVKKLGLEVVLFSLLIGLVISNFFRIPSWVQPMIQTELYIKIGLVLLGCSIIFQEVLKAGLLGLMQSLIVVFAVWQVSFWLSKKFKLDDELRAMLASAVAICGVSAAIATAGAIKGDSKKLSYVISLVLITAIPMMLFMPYLANAMGLSNAVAGAWLGGTIDTTGAVVAAGTSLGEEGLKYATVVKFSQNVLLGFAAFAISIYWTYKKKETADKPSLKTIWERFPKFVIGFILASFLFSFIIPTEVITRIKDPLKSIQTGWFALAFTCIGLETKFTDIFRLDNGRPAYAFLLAQLFNILFTLVVAWLIFG